MEEPRLLGRKLYVYQSVPEQSLQGESAVDRCCESHQIDSIIVSSSHQTSHTPRQFKKTRSTRETKCSVI
jgi:hypothetical protein